VTQTSKTTCTPNRRRITTSVILPAFARGKPRRRTPGRMSLLFSVIEYDHHHQYQDCITDRYLDRYNYRTARSRPSLYATPDSLDTTSNAFPVRESKIRCAPSATEHGHHPLPQNSPAYRCRWFLPVLLVGWTQCRISRGAVSGLYFPYVMRNRKPNVGRLCSPNKT